MTDREDRLNDDDKPWGHVEDGEFYILPKGPMLASGLGPPPFDVKLPDGRVRHVCHRPDSSA
jgi:hypothetical protein